MKKNRMMRLASVLLVLTLLTTSMISGTFAKYVSAGSAQDAARVAKWGVTVEASGSLFGRQYKNGELSASVPTASTTASEISVAINNSSAATEKLVAPGTKNDAAFSFGVKGTPEVDVAVTATINAKDIYLAAGTYGVMQKISVDAAGWADATKDGTILYTYASNAYTKATSWAANTDYYKLAYTASVETGGYYPVVYDYSGDSNAKTADAIAAAVAKAVNGGIEIPGADSNGTKTYLVSQKAYEANTDLSDALGIDEETIDWEWSFEVGANDNAKAANNAKDTILGDLMAAGTSNTTVVSVGTDNAVTVLTTDANKQVLSGASVVGCLETKFDITITVEQVD